MITKKASGYRNDPMGAECGNQAVAILRHKFRPADVEGDVIQLGEFGFDTCYYRISVASGTGLGAGCTIDLGYHGKETGEAYPTYFKGGIDVANAGRKVLDCATFDMRDGGKGEIHDVIMTIHGNPADGACIEVIMEYIHNGH